MPSAGNSKMPKHADTSDDSDLMVGETSSGSTDVEMIDNSMSMTARYVTVGILFLVNLLNYMDRYTIAGVLDKVEKYYNIDDQNAGLLQAVFIVGYMLLSPVFGWAGDRYSRKYLMLGGIMFWSAVTLASSFIPPNCFWLFVLLRCLVGIGEASYSTIAPTLISDMFVQSKRSVMLMFFYFAIPVGSGLGYVVGSGVASKAIDITHDPASWAWALRVTPSLGVVCCLLILFVTRDPPRGMAEHAAHTHSHSNILQDVKALCKIKSFMLDTFGFVCVAFVAGALALFAPSFILEAYTHQQLDITEAKVSLYFGVLTCGAGFLGIALGSAAAYQVKKREPGGDAIVCAFGLISSSIFLFLAILIIEFNIVISWVLIFLGMTFVCLNWSLTADILLYTVVPTRRSTAEAFMIFIGHLLGDAGSPYFVGLMSDALQKHGLTRFKSLQYSLYSCAIVAMLGGGLFLYCSLFIESDRAKADAITHGASEEEADATPLPFADHIDDDDDAALIDA